MKKLVFGTLFVFFVLNVVQLLTLNMAHASYNGLRSSTSRRRDGDLKSSRNAYRVAEKDLEEQCLRVYADSKSYYLTQLSAWKSKWIKNGKPSPHDLRVPYECERYWDYENLKNPDDDIVPCVAIPQGHGYNKYRCSPNKRYLDDIKNNRFAVDIDDFYPNYSPTPPTYYDDCNNCEEPTISRQVQYAQPTARENTTYTPKTTSDYDSFKRSGVIYNQ